MKFHEKTDRLRTLEQRSNAWPLACLNIKQPSGEVKNITTDQWYELVQDHEVNWDQTEMVSEQCTS